MPTNEVITNTHRRTTKEPVAVSSNFEHPHKELLDRLKAGIAMLHKAPTPENTIGIPTIVFDKKNASEAITERTASGVRNTIYMYAEEDRKGNIPTVTAEQKLPGLTIKVDAPHIGLNSKLERRVTLEGDAEIVAAYTKKEFNVQKQIVEDSSAQLTHLKPQTNEVIAA